MVAGYRRFRDNAWVKQRSRWTELAGGQAPGVLVIACSDSRVDPSQIFDVGPGEIFVVRNVAALVPPYEVTPGRHGVSAAIEFAVQVLKVKEIVVMGHGLCGGCKAALTQDLKEAEHGAGRFVADWIDILDDAREKVVERHGDDRGTAALTDMESEAVKVSLDNLRTFPFVREKEAAGELRLVGSRFAIDDGVLNILDEKTGSFSPA